MPINRSTRSGLLPLLALALVVLAQLPLVLNPGYFSHDELQWAAHAIAGPRIGWLAFETFQYRPLTFTVWSALSRQLFETPQAFHAVLVAGGALNAAMACLVARRLGAAAGPALAGAVLFGLGPQAMYVHGWIGTIGDVLWLGLGLLAALVATSRRLPLAAIAVLAAVFTALALLSKEAALSIPPLLALGAWLAAAHDRDLRRRLAVAAGAAGVVAAAYLAVRLGTLLDAPRSGTAYSLSPWHAPMRWLEQQLYPFDPGVMEVHVQFARGIDKRVVAAGLLWLGVVASLSRAGWRWPVAFLLGGIAALAPALPLAASANQYAYGFACVATLVVACAWPRLPRVARAVVVLAGVLVLWHGVAVMGSMRKVGERQARFSPAVADVLRGRGEPLRLQMGDGADAWIYLRLTHDIPQNQGVPFGDRVRIVGEGEPADMTVNEDGSLSPVAQAQ